jgi:hypothetical protein
MARLGIRTLLSRYAVAWAYLIAVVITGIVQAALSRSDRAALLRWASTNVVNLRHDPVGSLAASAFFTAASAAAWPALIALAMFGANRALGNWRTVLVCAAGQVIGTLVSEGILGYREARGLLPAADRYIIDVGPSYVVVSAIVVAILYGSWLARGAAAADFVILVFVGQIFSGLSRLDVAAVGHLTAIVVAAILGSLLIWRLRHPGTEAMTRQGAADGQEPVPEAE